MKLPLSVVLRVLLLVLGGVLAAGVASADSRDLPNERALERRIATLEARKDMDPAVKSRVVDLYKQAIAEVQGAQRLRDETDELRSQMAAAPEAIRTLERRLQLLEKKEPEPPAKLSDEATSLEQLEQMELQARTQVNAANQTIGELDRGFEETATRPLDARRELEELRTAIAAAEAAVLPDQRKRAAASGLTEAEYTLARARQETRRRQLDRLTQELAYQPFQLRITQLRRDVARSEARRATAKLQQVREVLQQRRMAAVATARQEAQRKRSEVDLLPPVRELAAGNAELRASVAETALTEGAVLAEIAARRSELAQLEGTMRLLQRRAGTPSGGDLGTALIRNLSALPSAGRFAKARAQRELLLGRTTQANAVVETDLAALSDLNDALARRMTALGAMEPDQRAVVEAEVTRQLSERRAQLTRLDNIQNDLLRALHEAEEAELELLTSAAAARAKLGSLLFWTPINPIGAHTFTDLDGALRWMLAAGNWRTVAEAVPAAMRQAPGRFAVILLLTAALLWWRARLKPYLGSIAPGAVPLEQFRISHTLGALGITLLLALPWGLLAWGLGTLLRAAPTSSAFARAIGSGLAVAGVIVMVGQGFAWLLDQRGVAVNHFGWVAEKARTVKHELRRLLRTYVPLAFIAVSASASYDPAMRYSLGRLALLLALVMVSRFWARNMRPRDPYIRRDAGAGAGVLPLPLAAMAYWTGIALPLALGLLAAVGYYYAAAVLYQLLIKTLLLWLGGVMLYGLLALWVLVQHARLARHDAQAPLITDSAEGSIVRRRVLDIASIGGQARQMLNLLITLVFVIGLYWIWHGAVPALEVVGDLELWRYADTVDGEKVNLSLTLGGLFLALAVVTVTLIAARNIGGLFDAMLLERLALQPDANYAIKTVARYAIVGAGVIAAANLFGISWSRVQWLVAALGVGLGFGLQEIVANFVSGLIVLAERPIRVGDTVTVGEVTGTVGRIRARATLITDFDNKEVLIPNKAFITERVVNWTLSSQVTRVLIKVGVAYGTDTTRAREVIAAALRLVPLVLDVLDFRA